METTSEGLGVGLNLQRVRPEIELANLGFQIEQLSAIGALARARYQELIVPADRAGETLGAVELPANADNLHQTVADLLSGLKAAGGAAERIVAFRRGTEEPRSPAPYVSVGPEIESRLPRFKEPRFLVLGSEAGVAVLP